jgi:uncharacterized protein YjbI with pentapeptide repeats
MDIRQQLLAGEAVELAEAGDRVVPAEWLNEVARGQSLACAQPIRLTGAIVEGDVAWQHVQFAMHVALIDCEVRGTFDATSAAFRRGLDLTGSRFSGKVVLENAEAEDRLTMKRCRVEGVTSCRGLHVAGTFDGSGSDFGAVSFGHARIDDAMHFRTVNDVPVLFRGDASFVDASVGSVIEFRSTQFCANASFTRMRAVNFFVRAERYAKDSVAKRRPIFHAEVEFTAMHMAGQFDCRGTWFNGPVSAERLHARSMLFDSVIAGPEVVATVFMKAASFFALDCGSASFHGVQFHGDVNFSTSRFAGELRFQAASSDQIGLPTRFRGEARFIRVAVDGEMNLSGAQFDKAAVFDQMRVGATLFLGRAKVGEIHCPTRFRDRLSLHTVTIGGGLMAAELECGGRAVFDSTTVERSFLFSLPDSGGAVFRSNASFLTVSVKATFSASRTRFLSHVTFGGSRVGVEFLLRDLSYVGGTLSLRGVAAGRVDLSFLGCDGRITLDYADIAGGLSLYGVYADSASFQSTSVKRDAVFTNATFHDDVNFEQMAVDGRAYFGGAVIVGKADFSDASMSSFIMSDAAQSNPARFLGPVDLSRFRFGHFGGEWQSLLAKTEPFHRDTYTRFERVYRAAGDEREAGRIYFARRVRERKWMFDRAMRRSTPALPWLEAFGEALRWLFDVVQRLLFRYGVRPLRLLVLSILFVGAGTHVFSRPGAVQTRAALMAQQQVVSTARLSTSEALGLSIRLFIPGVELPAAQQWVPSSAPLRFVVASRYLDYSSEAYATLHRLAGLLLVPLGVAALTGLLVRRER